MRPQRIFIFLIVILIIAGSLRLYGLSRGDTLTDEIFYSFRAIKMLDFDEAGVQTTPLEWFDPRAIERRCDPQQNLKKENTSETREAYLPEGTLSRICMVAEKNGTNHAIPAWTRLSFHDHPPLVFLVQNIFIKIFGETNFAFRLPSVLLGLASVYLLYLIGSLLYTREVGLLSALFLGVTVNHVYFSRTGLQEPYVIFFILLASYFFLKALHPHTKDFGVGVKKDNFLIWTGIAIGFALLAKYTTFILIPIFLIYLLIFKREYFWNKKLWLGAALALIILSPVIIYNIELYRTVGHFDFQISYLISGPPEVWPEQPGKETGTLEDRIFNFIPNLIDGHSWVFLSMFAFALVSFFFMIFKKPKETLAKHSFLTIAVLSLLLLISAIGPSFRFLSMLTPFLALGIAVFTYAAYQKLFQNKPKIAYVLLALIVIFEISYSINSQIIYYPKGKEVWAYSYVRYENYNWGYNELAKFLKKELDGKMPQIAFEIQYEFLEKIQLESFEKDLKAGKEEYPALIIYDGNVQMAAQLWVLDRLQIYHGWPVIKTETYFDFLEEKGFDYFYRSGFKNYYFIIPTNKVPLKSPVQLTNTGQKFEEQLRTQLEPISIKNQRGEEVFRVYKF